MEVTLVEGETHILAMAESNIHTLAFLAPELKSFKFDGYAPLGLAILITSHFASLENLTITELSSYASFLKLASLPRLRKLHLTPLGRWNQTDVGEISLYSNTLAQIEWNGSSNDMIAILKAIPTPNVIEHIALGAQRLFDGGHYRTLFQLLSQNFSQLRKLRLAAFGEVPNPDAHIDEVTFADLEPLQGLDFEQLDLQFPTPIHITPEELGPFGRAWPNIKVFKLTSFWSSYTSQIFPIQVLQTFTRHSFPLLQELGIAIDTRLLGTAPEYSGALQSDTLTSIDLRGSHLSSENSTALAQLLGLTFPNLRRIDGTPVGAEWAQVPIILDIMRLARLDEQRRLKGLEEERMGGKIAV
jgi:hypothetical protein